MTRPESENGETAETSDRPATPEQPPTVADDQTTRHHGPPGVSAGEFGTNHRLGPYQLFRVIGSGGMGIVHEARDVHTGRAAAVKVMRPQLAADETARKRFLREARAMASVEHDRIIPLWHIDEADGVPYIAMPFLEGETLADRLARDGALPIDESLRIAEGIAEGLSAAHAQGLIHRDIKPSNVWLRAGERPGVVLLDLGLARAAYGGTEVSSTGAILGTAAYMAPEQARGRPVDHRCDLFSLGVVLYEMTTGKRPFQGEDFFGTLAQVVNETPAKPRKLQPAIPKGLARLTETLMEKSPERRPGSAEEVVGSLRRLRESGDLPPDSGTRKRWYRRAAAAAVVLLVGLGIASLGSGGRDSADDSRTGDGNRADVARSEESAGNQRGGSQVTAKGVLPKRRALVIGVNEYDSPDFGRLDFAVNDADAMASALNAAGFEVVLMTDPESNRRKDATLVPTAANIRAGVKRLAESTSADEVALMFFAGRGGNPDSPESPSKGQIPSENLGNAGGKAPDFKAPLQDQSNQQNMQERGNRAGIQRQSRTGFLYPKDGRLGPQNQGTLIDLDRDVFDPLDSAKGHRLVLIDGCRSGAWADPLAGRSAGLSAMFACEPGAASLELPKLGHGLFTYFILEGLHGKAAQEKTAFITWGSLSDYVRGAVSSEGAALLPLKPDANQRPVLYGSQAAPVRLAKVPEEPARRALGQGVGRGSRNR